VKLQNSFKYKLKIVWYKLCAAADMVDKLCAVPYEALLDVTSKTNHKVSLVGIWRMLATGKQNTRFDLFPERKVNR
jgi:hypothetical protein